MALRRRRKHSDGRTVTAAATRMPLTDPRAIKRLWKPAEEWQTEAWQWFDVTPEIKFVVWWVGNLMSKVKFYAAVEDANGEAVAIDAYTEDENGVRTWVAPDVPDAVRAQAIAEVDRLRLKSGGRGTLLRKIGMNEDIAGDCYLIGYGEREAIESDDPLKARPAEPERWEIRSVREVEVKSGKCTVGGADNKRVLDPTRDTWIRIYQEHPAYGGKADSNVRSVISQCRMLQVLEGEIMAESLSRHNAGIILTKAGTKWVTTADGSNTDEEELGLAEGVAQLVTEAIAEVGDPSSVVPNIAEVEDIDKALKWISIGRTPNELTDKRIAARIDRLAAGINAPKEVVLGHRSTTFANAQQIGEDEFVDHLEPRILLACDGLTEGFLKYQMLYAGGESAAWADRVFIWYDASALMDPPDLAKSATEGLRNFAINWKAWRAANGFTEEDAPTPDEQLQMVGLLRGIFTAEITQALLQKLDPTFVATPVEDGTTDQAAADPEMTALVAALGGQHTAKGLLMQVLGLTYLDPPTRPAIEASAADGQPPPRPQ